MDCPVKAAAKKNEHRLVYKSIKWIIEKKTVSERITDLFYYKYYKKLYNKKIRKSIEK